MNIEPTAPKWMVYTLYIGVIFLGIGFALADIYTVVAASLLIAMGTICLTGEKVIQHSRHQPKGL